MTIRPENGHRPAVECKRCGYVVPSWTGGDPEKCMNCISWFA